MSPPLAVGKVYRADHHVYPLQLGDSRNPSEGCVSELIGAFYPKSPLAANSPHTPFVPPAATPGRTGSGLNMVSTWAGTGAPQTSAAQFGQQQPDSPQLQHVPPPPPPRPAPQDGPKQEQHLQVTMLHRACGTSALGSLMRLFTAHHSRLYVTWPAELAPAFFYCSAEVEVSGGARKSHLAVPGAAENGQSTCDGKFHVTG